MKINLHMPPGNIWANVESKPPPLDGTPILVCTENYTDKKYGYPETAMFKMYHPNAQGKKTWRTPSGIKISFTHWMNMPKQPKIT